MGAHNPSRLSASTIEAISDLLKHDCASHGSRRALFTHALDNHPIVEQLNYNQEPVGVFLTNTITELHNYGEIEPGITALWKLLDYMYARVGYDKKALIRDLQRGVKSPGAKPYQARSASSESSDRFFSALLGHINAAISKKEFTDAIDMAMYDSGKGQTPQMREKAAEAYYRRGQSSAVLNNHERAIADFRQAIALEATDGDYYCSLGISLTQLKQYEEAIIHFDNALRLRPDYPIYHAHRAYAHYRLSKYKEAIESYKRAIGLDKSNAEYYVQIGFCHLENHEIDDAINAGNRALFLKPNHARANTLLGLCYQHRKQDKEARRYFKRAFELGDTNAAPHLN